MVAVVEWCICMYSRRSMLSKAVYCVYTHCLVALPVL